jgi:hypothetical protein
MASRLRSECLVEFKETDVVEDCNGIVDGSDLSTLLAFWGACS